MSFYFSVIVVTYNPVWDKLKATLDSILMQSIDDYEIIIADDGSKDSLHSNIVEYFKENSFLRYTHIENKKNQGTVKNVLSGLSVATGKYIKPISPGDMLYDKDSLESMGDFLSKGGYQTAFGLMEAYYIDEGGNYVITSFNHPFDLSSYRKGNLKKIERNLILYSDNVCGAAMCATKEAISKYLSQIQDIVIYEDDIFQVLSALDDNTFRLLDKRFVKYESNVGISTSGNSAFAKLLLKDVLSFYDYIYNLYPDNKWVKKRYSLRKLYKINNLYIRTILRFFVNPGLVIYMIDHWVQTILSNNQPRH